MKDDLLALAERFEERGLRILKRAIDDQNISYARDGQEWLDHAAALRARAMNGGQQ